MAERRWRASRTINPPMALGTEDSARTFQSMDILAPILPEVSIYRLFVVPTLPRPGPRDVAPGRRRGNKATRRCGIHLEFEGDKSIAHG